MKLVITFESNSLSPLKEEKELQSAHLQPPLGKQALNNLQIDNLVRDNIRRKQALYALERRTFM